MRVVFGGAYPARGAECHGGMQAVGYATAAELARRDGIEVHVVSVRLDGGPDETRVDRGVHVHLLAAANRLPFSLRVTGADPRRVRRVLEGIRPDVVHAHGIDAPAVAALDARVPTLLVVHGIARRDVQVEMRTLWDRVRLAQMQRLEQSCLTRARHVASTAPAYVSEMYRDLLRVPVSLVNNPVDDAYFDLPQVTTTGRILYVGFIRPLKGVHTLVDAFARIARTRPDLTLRLAGGASDESYRASLVARAQAAGVADRVSFLGFVSEEALREEVARCQILCHPSQQENSPVAVQQAMAAGRAIVASRAGGIPGLIDDGVTGVLTAIGDVDATATALASFADDIALCARFGDAARTAADARFRLTRVGDQLVALYRAAAEAPRSAFSCMPSLGDSS